MEDVVIKLSDYFPVTFEGWSGDGDIIYWGDISLNDILDAIKERASTFKGVKFRVTVEAVDRRNGM